MKEYTLFLNYFNKPVELMKKQLDAIVNQSHRPYRVVACFLGTPDKGLVKEFQKYRLRKKLKNWYWCASSVDFKYIGRYQLAITAPTDMVVMLDDDRIPQRRALESMVQVAWEKDAIINQYGWRLEKNADGEWEDQSGEFYTVAMMNDEKWREAARKTGNYLYPVDYLCGGMIFNKKHLRVLFGSEIPTITTGEDIIFCLQAKNAGVPVLAYMPAILHPGGEDAIDAKHGNISSTLHGDKVDKIHKLRSLLIKKYKD